VIILWQLHMWLGIVAAAALVAATLALRDLVSLKGTDQKLLFFVLLVFSLLYSAQMAMEIPLIGPDSFWPAVRWWGAAAFLLISRQPGTPAGSWTILIAAAAGFLLSRLVAVAGDPRSSLLLSTIFPAAACTAAALRLALSRSGRRLLITTNRTEMNLAAANLYFAAGSLFHLMAGSAYLPALAAGRLADAVAMVLIAQHMIKLLLKQVRLELIHAHEDQRRQEQMTILRYFTDKMAHEIKNSLTVIRMRVQMMQMQAQNQPPTRTEAANAAHSAAPGEALSRLIAGVDRINEQLEEWLQPVRLNNLAKTIRDLGDLLEAAFARWRPELSDRDLGLRFYRSEEPMPVEVDEEWLEHALGFIVHHAVKTMPKGASLTVKLFREKDRATIAVKDGGDGEILPAGETARQLGQEEFVTSGIINLGLDLALAAWIIAHHNGKLKYDTSSMEGTTYYCSLPLYRRQFDLVHDQEGVAL